MTEEHRRIVEKNINQLGGDADLQALTRMWIREVAPYKYTYNFAWLGVPIIQFPQDVHALQEICWNVRPEVIVETGVAHGGSLVFSASMLALLDLCEGISPDASVRKVIGIDIDIRPHNRSVLDAHPLRRWMELIEGSSISRDMVGKLRSFGAGTLRTLVILDSNHTHDHVLEELNIYSPLVSAGSYCIVFDTAIEDMPERFFSDRPWGPGNSPKSAVHAFLKDHPEFEIDRSIPDKLQITVAPDGYLKRVRP